MRAALILAVSLVIASPAPAEDGWVEIAREDGVVVSSREVEGRDLPVFRGTTLIEASIYEILAVMNDVGRLTEWQEGCVEARLVKTLSDMEAIVYHRTGTPWPIADRDVVLRTETVIVEPGRRVELRFRSTDYPSVEVPSGTVRMPKLEGYYRLEVVDPGRTSVEYRVDSDPGGRLPTWLARRGARDLPLGTLRKLRRQVAATKGSYQAFLDRWDPARRETSLPAVSLPGAADSEDGGQVSAVPPTPATP